MDLVQEVYACTRDFPKEELFGLTSQLRRAAVSVPSNIAEGKGRSSDRDLLVFLHHSLGSLLEIETQLSIAKRLGYLSVERADHALASASQLAKLLHGLIRSLDRELPSKPLKPH